MKTCSLSLTIIVPCYNEHIRFPKKAFTDFIEGNPEIQICFVNDGSSDRTGEIINDLRSLFSSSIHAVHLVRNEGKAGAVRAGMLFMMKNFPTTCISYIDADLSTPFEEVERLASILLNEERLLFIFGSRVSVFGSKIRRRTYRHYGGRVIATLIDAVLDLAIYDTQCGLKIFRSTLAADLFKDPFLDRWLFDVEIFAKMKLIYSRDEMNLVMREIPINEWMEMGNSKIKLTDIVRIPLSLVAIKNKYQLRPEPNSLSGLNNFSDRFPLIAKILKFALTGFTGMIIDFSFTILCKEYLNFNPFSANIIGMFIAIIVIFILNKRWTFNDSDVQVRRQFEIFFIISVIGIACNSMLLAFFYRVLLFDFYISKVLAILIVATWNFAMNSLFTFKSYKSNFIKVYE